MKIGTVIGLAAVAAVLAAATQYTERRGVPAWAPNASIAKPKPVEAASQGALPDKMQAALSAAPRQAAPLPAPASELPVAARPSTVDSDATGGLPKEPEAAAQAPAAQAPAEAAHAPAPREHRQARPARPARAADTAPARPAPPRDPIQFRLAERGGN